MCLCGSLRLCLTHSLFFSSSLQAKDSETEPETEPETERGGGGAAATFDPHCVFFDEASNNAAEGGTTPLSLFLSFSLSLSPCLSVSLSPCLSDLGVLAVAISDRWVW